MAKANKTSRVSISAYAKKLRENLCMKDSKIPLQLVAEIEAEQGKTSRPHSLLKQENQPNPAAMAST